MARVPRGPDDELRELGRGLWTPSEGGQGSWAWKQVFQLGLPGGKARREPVGKMEVNKTEVKAGAQVPDCVVWPTCTLWSWVGEFIIWALV